MKGGNAADSGLAGEKLDYVVTVHTENGEVTAAYCALTEERLLMLPDRLESRHRVPSQADCKNVTA
jgi:hypothetical protein